MVSGSMATRAAASSFKRSKNNSSLIKRYHSV
jgi:hypothetical protein